MTTVKKDPRYAMQTWNDGQSLVRYPVKQNQVAVRPINDYNRYQSSYSPTSSTGSCTPTSVCVPVYQLSSTTNGLYAVSQPPQAVAPVLTLKPPAHYHPQNAVRSRVTGSPYSETQIAAHPNREQRRSVSPKRDERNFSILKQSVEAATSAAEVATHVVEQAKQIHDQVLKMRSTGQNHEDHRERSDRDCNDRYRRPNNSSRSQKARWSPSRSPDRQTSPDQLFQKRSTGDPLLRERRDRQLGGRKRRHHSDREDCHSDCSLTTPKRRPLYESPSKCISSSTPKSLVFTPPHKCYNTREDDGGKDAPKSHTAKGIRSKNKQTLYSSSESESSIDEIFREQKRVFAVAERLHRERRRLARLQRKKEYNAMLALQRCEMRNKIRDFERERDLINSRKYVQPFEKKIASQMELITTLEKQLGSALTILPGLAPLIDRERYDSHPESVTNSREPEVGKRGVIAPPTSSNGIASHGVRSGSGHRIRQRPDPFPYGQQGKMLGGLSESPQKRYLSPRISANGEREKRRVQYADTCLESVVWPNDAAVPLPFAPPPPPNAKPSRHVFATPDKQPPPNPILIPPLSPPVPVPLPSPRAPPPPVPVHTGSLSDKVVYPSRQEIPNSPSHINYNQTDANPSGTFTKFIAPNPTSSYQTQPSSYHSFPFPTQTMNSAPTFQTPPRCARACTPPLERVQAPPLPSSPSPPVPQVQTPKYEPQLLLSPPTKILEAAFTERIRAVGPGIVAPPGSPLRPPVRTRSAHRYDGDLSAQMGVGLQRRGIDSGHRLREEKHQNVSTDTSSQNSRKRVINPNIVKGYYSPETRSKGDGSDLSSIEVRASPLMAATRPGESFTFDRGAKDEIKREVEHEKLYVQHLENELESLMEDLKTQRHEMHKEKRRIDQERRVIYAKKGRSPHESSDRYRA